MSDKLPPLWGKRPEINLQLSEQQIEILLEKRRVVMTDKRGRRFAISIPQDRKIPDLTQEDFEVIDLPY
jgi:hypothetical protein